jgi:hypothetical protein
MVVSVQSVIVAAGSSGNGIDVDLTNTGPSSLTVAGFSFGISIANTDISFTDANTATAAPYIFAGNSLFGPDLTGPTSGQTLSTSDIFSIPGGSVTLNAGTTVGLGHVLFDVSAGAAGGSFPVDFQLFPTTSLSDQSGANIPITTLSSGSITIPAAAVPEPSAMLPLVFGVAGLLSAAGWRRRARQNLMARTTPASQAQDRPRG